MIWNDNANTKIPVLFLCSSVSKTSPQLYQFLYSVPEGIKRCVEKIGLLLIIINDRYFSAITSSFNSLNKMSAVGKIDFKLYSEIKR